MSSARWVMVLGLVGSVGCGGIPIVSGDPFVPDAARERDTDIVVNTDLGRDADPMVARDAPDADRLDAPDAPDTPDALDAPDVLDAPDASALDAPDASLLDASDADDFDRPEVRGVDAPLAEVARNEVFVSDGASTADIDLPAEDSGGPCALCGRGTPLICCDSRCRDPRTDRFNCGGCGVVCPDADDCVLGVCLPRLDASAPDAASIDLGAPDVATIDLGAPEVATSDVGVPDVLLSDRSTPIIGADGGVP